MLLLPFAFWARPTAALANQRRSTTGTFEESHTWPNNKGKPTKRGSISRDGMRHGRLLPKMA